MIDSYGNELHISDEVAFAKPTGELTLGRILSFQYPDWVIVKTESGNTCVLKNISVCKVIPID